MIPVVYCGNYYIFHGILLSSISIARRTTSALNIIILTMTYTKYNDKYISNSVSIDFIEFLTRRYYLIPYRKSKSDIRNIPYIIFETSRNLKNIFKRYTMAFPWWRWL